MKCPNCHGVLPDDSTFCIHCGSKIEAPTSKRNVNRTALIAGGVIAAVAVIAVIVVVVVLGGKGKQTYSVQYETDGGSAIAAVQVEEGSQATSPSNPKKDGYEFAGWYSDPECTDKVRFPFEPKKDTVLYAKWEEKEEAPSSSSGSANGATKSKSSSSGSKGSYIVSNSSDVRLSRSDLSSLSDDDLEIAMNEIWARHGRMFKNNWLQSYFNSQPWYKGTIAADDFLGKYTPTAIEDENSKLMSAMLSERGYDVNKRHPN